jgi:glycosyltransferase involved in cell wall biosynthesis
LRIAIWHNLPSGGGKRALYNHVKALLARGHTLEAWTTDLSSADYLPLSDLIPEHRLRVRDEIAAARKTSSFIRREHRIHEVLEKHYKKCLEEMDRGSFDLLFANSCSLTYMPRIGLYTDMPSLLYLGEPFRPLYEAMPQNVWSAPYLKLRIRKIKRIARDFQVTYANRIKVHREIAAARSYRKILVNSLFSRESVLRAYGVEARVSYPGVDTLRFQANPSSKEPYVVGLGTIGRIKGVHLAIRILGEIPKSRRPALRWVANGVEEAYFEEMKQYAEKLRVVFIPLLNISEEELTQTLSRAAVMLYTSRLEPFGLAPLEANACSTYVIANAEGGVRESIANNVNGTLVYNCGIEEFAREVDAFTSDLDQALERGRNAREYVMEQWDQRILSVPFIKEIEELFSIASK